VRANEGAFEAEICDWLVAHGGYDAVKVGNRQGAPTHFDPVRGLDTAELFAFLGATQADEWERLKKLHGGDPDVAQAKFADRLAKELDSRGTVDVLRHGVVDLGVTIRLAYFRPAHGLTPELLHRYEANRLTVTRQLPYEAESIKTLDVCLLVNGLPVATAELKNPLTGQSVGDAKKQYRNDRDPGNVTLARRAVVHFAVDPEDVAMTTRLEGPATRFLPFNKGTATHDAGNPPNPVGHRTAYLWQELWQRDAWLDVLARFVHVEKPGKGSRAPSRVIFPRYHQWDAVRKLEAATLSEGPGHDYLVEHSAGSGKSNTIAWLAHRLSSLHNAADTKVFDKVVVITDRKVLDRQLQDTIYQFEHAHGVVQKIDVNSAQLAEALAGQQARIIITTLQKFPVVLEQGVALPSRRYAVIVDEAHSSQTGEAAKDLNLVLGGGASADEELAAAEDAEGGELGLEEPADPVADALERAAAARGKQENVSFYAFTATPKGKTLERFGRVDPATGMRAPFHLYSMRQAIAEGFILDTLANYVTYTAYFHLEKAILDDPAYDTSRAKAAIARFVMLHPHQLAQKAEVIVEHFQRHVRHRVGGRAKAMVVTSSRLHAVRYQQALKRYITDHGYDLGVLVAFSGTVHDGAADYTEANMNGLPESQTVDALDGDEHHVLVVAEKYQTGFDQPLLCAMYVDKVLTGLNAVQTLSRLNRIHELKRQEDVFVLDFRNDADAIREAFEPWYGETVAPPTDPNLLYDTRHALDEFGVLWPAEVEAVARLIVGPGRTGDHGRIHAALALAIDRVNALDDDERDRFRDALARFVRTYSFLTQIVTFSDAKLERDYLFCKALVAFLAPAAAASFDLGTEVELTHLRLEKVAEGAISLGNDQGEVRTIFSGMGPEYEPDEEPLSQIIAQINERSGTSFAPEDRLFYDAVAAKLVSSTDVQQAAAANSPANFRLLLERLFLNGVVDQLDVSQDLAVKYLDDFDVQSLVLGAYLPMIQRRAQVAWQETCPIGELLGPVKESASLEYKATLRIHAAGPDPGHVVGEVFKPLETATVKTIAAFLNSSDGGTLLIGVADDGAVTGLASDYASLHKAGKDDRDSFLLHLGYLLSAAMGDAAASQVRAEILTVEGEDLCRVHAHPSGFPVDATVLVDRKGQLAKETAFFVRVGNATKKLDEVEREKYLSTRWPAR
jgi:type I restriction enzyme R subunit